MSTRTLPGTPAEVREQIRSGQWRGVTSGVAPGFVQANLAILPKELAFDFLLFCQRNPRPCPLLEVIEAGSTEPALTAPGADIRTDIPGYRVYEDGQFTAEVDSLLPLWHDDLVSFLLGCSFSFETAMVDAGMQLRHQEMGCNVPMYITNIPTTPAGMFSGPMVVSMRPIKHQQIVRAVQVTSRFPATHGAPVHIDVTRTDIPGYRVYEDGQFTAEVDSLLPLWHDDLVSFLLGCSFSFETAMVDAGMQLRHQEMGCNVPMYITNIPTTPAGMFSGPMVVSMRPIKHQQIVRAVQVTSRFPATHGAPVHIGNPGVIGIRDLSRPDFGDPVEIHPGEEPVFWACGVTPQAVALNSKPPLMITHAPGYMFITDQRDAEYAVL